VIVGAAHEDAAFHQNTQLFSVFGWQRAANVHPDDSALDPGASPKP
jgi:hypothetical protein